MGQGNSSNRKQGGGGGGGGGGGTGDGNVPAAPATMATVVPKTDADVITPDEAKAEVVALREFLASSDGQFHPATPLTDEIVNAWFADRANVQLPYVLFNATYRQNTQFENDWVETVSLGSGAYGTVMACVPREDDKFDGRAVSDYNMWSIGKEKTRREKHYADAGQLYAVKRIRKSTTPSGLSEIMINTAEEKKDYVKFWYKQWANEVHLLYLLNRTSKYTARLTAVYEDDAQLIVVMPRMQNTLLKAWKALNKAQKKEIGMRVMHQMLWVLVELKALKWVHCDLQLKNICVWGPLIDPDRGQIGIVDFGLATYLGDNPHVEMPRWFADTDLKIGGSHKRTYAYDVALMAKCILGLLNKNLDNVADADLKRMLSDMLKKNPARRPTVEQCLNEYGLFPEMKQDNPDAATATDDPLHGFQYQPRFNAHYEPLDDFAGGGDEEWDEGSDDYDDERDGRYGDTFARRLAKCREERERLLADNRALRHKLKGVAELVKKASRVARR